MHLMVFGFGYSARAVAAALGSAACPITATARSDGGVAAIDAAGHRGMKFDGTLGLDGALSEDVTHVLVSVPPTNPKEHHPDSGTPDDPVLAHCREALAGLRKLEWIGYLSTVGVYGDQAGRWVDEETPLAPSSERSRRRVLAEDAWRAFASELEVRLQIFRLAGIYGPGRNVIESLKKGRNRRIVKPGQVFNRVHVEDIATTVVAGMRHRGPEAVFNVCDDEPAPPDEVLVYAAQLAGLPVPPAVAFEEADLTPMARSFYCECKRVSNARIKGTLGVRLQYPTYREGLRAILASEDK